MYCPNVRRIRQSTDTVKDARLGPGVSKEERTVGERCKESMQRKEKHMFQTGGTTVKVRKFTLNQTVATIIDTEEKFMKLLIKRLTL